MRNIFKETKERYNRQILKIPEEEKQRREQSKYKNYILWKKFLKLKNFYTTYWPSDGTDKVLCVKLGADNESVHLTIAH